MQTNNYPMSQQTFPNPTIGQYPPPNKQGGNAVMSAGPVPPTLPLKSPQQSSIPSIPSMMAPNPGGYVSGVPLQPVMNYPPTAVQQNAMPPAGYPGAYGQAMPPHPGYQVKFNNNLDYLIDHYIYLYNFLIKRNKAITDGCRRNVPTATDNIPTPTVSNTTAATTTAT